jgi:hypothetical protein
MAREPAPLEKVDDVLSTDGVKGFPNIKLEEERGRLGLV